MSENIENKAPSVCILALPESSGAVLYGLYEVLSVFGEAWVNITGQTDNRAQFDVKIVAPTSTLFSCVGGVPVIPHAALDQVHSADVVIITDLAIDPDADHRNRWADISAWLNRMHDSGAMICSVCSGAVLLASSGLLDKKQATVHWAFIEHFQRFYPDVDLLPNRIIVPAGADSRCVTSGGMASWEELALYLFAHFYGAAIGNNVSKLFLLGDRSDGQLLFAARGKLKRHDDAVVSKVQSWIANNYEAANPVTRMVDQSGLTTRSFKRRFRIATGYTPIDYVQALRVEEAKHLLEASSEAVDVVARQVGYEDTTSFRRTFKKLAGVTPGRYRQRFSLANRIVASQDGSAKHRDTIE